MGGKRWWSELNWLLQFLNDLGNFYGKNTLSVTFWLYPYFFHLTSIFSKSPRNLVVKDASLASNCFFRISWQNWLQRLRRFWPWYYRLRYFFISCAHFFFGVHIFNLVQVWAVNSQANDQAFILFYQLPIWVGRGGAKMTWVS